MTEGTLKLSEHITMDGINVHNKTIEYLNKQSKKNKSLMPYMDMRSRQFALDRVRAYGYDKWINIKEGIKFKFLPAGHISFASMVLIEIRDGYDVETILYTGDTSVNRDIPFTMKPNIEKLKITQLITETTYASVYIPQVSEDDMIEKLYNMIKKSCVEKKGDLLIPSFAMSRATNLSYYLYKTYKKYPELNNVPIFMASPLMHKCHKTIGEGFEFYDSEWMEYKDLFSWSGITSITEYKDLLSIMKTKGGKVIISSSGMADNGYNSFLVSEIIKSRKNIVCFVGYCAENTTGRKLLDGTQKTLTSNIDGEKVTVNIRANIENLQGLSSHASGKEILVMMKTAEKKKLKNVILVHGDKDRCDIFKDMINNEYKGSANVHIPRIGQIIKLT